MAPEVPIDAKSREQMRGEVDRMKNPNLAAAAVLIACPKCQAWPMAVNIKCHLTSDQKSGDSLSGSPAHPVIGRRCWPLKLRTAN